MESQRIIDLLEKIEQNQNLMVSLLAHSALKEKSLKEQVFFLNSIGMKPTEIANILGKTPNLIRVTLHGIKNKGIKEAETN